jgi:hypothetical protein
LVDWDEFSKNELANNGKVLYDNMNKMLGVDKATKSVADDIKVTTDVINDTADEIKVTTDVIKGTTDDIKDLVTPPKYDTTAKYAGCDGIDQDFVEGSDTNMADNCEEDNILQNLCLLERLPAALTL